MGQMGYPLWVDKAGSREASGAEFGAFLMQNLLAKPGPKVPLLDFVGVLLWFCRRTQVDYFDYLSTDDRLAALKEIEGKIGAFLGSMLSEATIDWWSRQDIDVKFLCEFLSAMQLSNGAATAPLVVWVRATALAFDRVSGMHFEKQFVAMQGTTAALRAEMPVVSRRLDTIRSKRGVYRLACDPDKIDCYPDRLRNLRLAPDHLPLRVKIHNGISDQLRFLLDVDENSFAVASLRAIDFGDFDASYHIKRDFERRAFVDVWPTRADAQFEGLIKLLREANDAGAKAVVFPELCLHPDHVAQLKGAFLSLPNRRVQLWVAGTCHVADQAGRRSNRLIALAAPPTSSRAEPIHHDKFGRFVFRDRSPQGLIDLHEDIDKPPALTLYQTGGVLVGFLVCKDLLEIHCLELLGALGPRFLFVSAMSKEAMEFRLSLGYLVSTANTWAVVSNSTAEGQESALWSRPCRVNPVLARKAPNDENAVFMGPQPDSGKNETI